MNDCPQTSQSVGGTYERVKQKYFMCLQMSAPPAMFDLICHSLQTSNQLPLDMALQIKSQRDDEGQVSRRAVISSQLS